jgi:FkbM family methyltransferase
MLKTILRKAISHKEQLKPLTWLLRHTGILSLARWAYYRPILARGTDTITLMGVPLTFVVSSQVEYRRVHNLYDEEWFMGQLLNAIRPGDIVFDVGANVGVVSLLIAKKNIEKDIHVHAFEPEPRNAEHLRRNVALNGLNDVVTVHEIALSDQTGSAVLWTYGPAGEGTHSMVDKSADDAGCIEIKTETIADFVTRTGFRPNVMKIDVEGAEFMVLKGAAGILNDGAVRDLFMELHPSPLHKTGVEVPDVLRILTQSGLSLVDSRTRGSEQHLHYVREDPASGTTVGLGRSAEA